LLRPDRADSRITVVPVIPTETALVVMRAPPESFGTRRSIEPLLKSTLRPALLKLKDVFAPRRVIVSSRKVSSDRESSPVRTPVPSFTLSFTTADFAADLEGRSLTSRMTRVTRASFGDVSDATPTFPATKRTDAGMQLANNNG
jgi:hypothetical protein